MLCQVLLFGVLLTFGHSCVFGHGNGNHKPRISKAVAVISGSNNGVSGTINFVQDGDILHIDGVIKGLTPGDHGFHVHQFGNLTAGCMSAGTHFNPAGKHHGAPSDEDRHAGDLGNIKAGNNGEAIVSVVDNHISLHGWNSIVGRAVVVHEKIDDLGQGGNEESLKTGNAGGRIGCGIVGVAEEIAPPPAAHTK